MSNDSEDYQRPKLSIPLRKDKEDPRPKQDPNKPEQPPQWGRPPPGPLKLNRTPAGALKLKPKGSREEPVVAPPSPADPGPVNAGEQVPYPASLNPSPEPIRDVATEAVSPTSAASSTANKAEAGDGSKPELTPEQVRQRKRRRRFGLTILILIVLGVGYSIWLNKTIDELAGSDADTSPPSGITRTGSNAATTSAAGESSSLSGLGKLPGQLMGVVEKNLGSSDERTQQLKQMLEPDPSVEELLGEPISGQATAAAASASRATNPQVVIELPGQARSTSQGSSGAAGGSKPVSAQQVQVPQQQPEGVAWTNSNTPPAQTAPVAQERRVSNYVERLPVNLVRGTGADVEVFIGGAVFRQGDLLDARNGLRLTGVDKERGILIFTDAKGARYEKAY